MLKMGTTPAVSASLMESDWFLTLLAYGARFVPRSSLFCRHLFAVTVYSFLHATDDKLSKRRLQASIMTELLTTL
jgi:hypothetical protein